MIASPKTETESTLVARPPALTEIVVEHGPPEVIGPALARLDRIVAQHAIRLEFASLSELMGVNRANRDNWFPLAPLFDPVSSGFGEANAFCLVARAAGGRIVGTHAARLYDWSGTSFRNEAATRRMFYADPNRMAPAAEVFEVSGSFGEHVGGRVVYSGAAWIHPAFRGLGLASVLPRFAKACILTKWLPDYVASLMLESNYHRGLARTFNYPSVEWEARWGETEATASRFAVVSIRGADLLDDLEVTLTRTLPEIDRRVEQRRA
jgi:hypothetical protein